jgi:hypothetical protein
MAPGIAGVGYIVYAWLQFMLLSVTDIADFGIELTVGVSSEHHGTVDITVSYYSEMGQGYYLAFRCGLDVCYLRYCSH